MIKLIYCIRKKPGMSDEEFSAYWEDVHGPIGACIPGLRRLVQCHALPAGNRVRPPDYDGIAELWFDDLASLERARRSPEWLASTADESNFIDPDGSAFLIAEEHLIHEDG